MIDGRNEIEHHYQLADKAQAEDAAGIAGLFLRATAEEAGRGAALLAGGSVRHHYAGDPASFGGIDTARLNDLGMSPMPFVFFDVTEAPQRVKVVHPLEMEVRFAPVQAFGQADLVALARWMRERPLFAGMAFALGFPQLRMGLTHVEAFKKRTGL